MRIVAGYLRGKTITAPKGDVTRPTADRARESLFNIVQSILLKQGRLWDEISFADVFSGSGAIGIEALSRGAKKVECFENHPEALSILRQNAKGIQNLKVIACDALNPPMGQPVDILFMDAPYGKGLWQKAIDAFYEAGYVNTQTLIIIETDKKLNEELPIKYDLIQDRSVGRNRFLFARFPNGTNIK